MFTYLLICFLHLYHIRKPSMPLMLQETAASLVAMAAEQKTVSLILIFGHHLRAGHAPEVSIPNVYHGNFTGFDRRRNRVRVHR